MDHTFPEADEETGKLIRVWMAPSHSNGSKFVDEVKSNSKKFGPHKIEFVSADNCKHTPAEDPKTCDIIWFSNTGGGNVRLPDSFYAILDDFIENKRPRPLILATFIIFFHDYENTDNYRLCPVFGVNKKIKMKDAPISEGTYTLTQEPPVWENVTKGPEYHCQTYHHSHYPEKGSWLQKGVLRDSVNIFAKDSRGVAAMWTNTGHKKNPRLLSAYVSQMLEYSTSEKDHQLLYNIIVWLASQQLMTWSPETHYLFPKDFQSQVLAIMLMAQRDYKGKPYHPEAPWFTLPRELIYSIFQYLF